MPVQLNNVQTAEIEGTKTTWYLDSSYSKFSIVVLIYFSYNYNSVYNFGQKMLDFQHVLNPKLQLTVTGSMVHNTGIISKELPYYDIDNMVNYFEQPDDIFKSFMARITPYVSDDFIYQPTIETSYSKEYVLQFKNEFDKNIVTQQLSIIQSELMSNHML